MAFSYHAPTRTTCSICEFLEKSSNAIPIIDSINGKASSANGFPFHNWYHFVLGYSPAFPQYILDQEKITQDDLVVDPFVGSGTTQLVCKYNKIPSIGIDANDFMVYAANQKLNWNADIAQIKFYKDRLYEAVLKALKQIDFSNNQKIQELAASYRPKYMDTRYISDKPLVKIYIIKEQIASVCGDSQSAELFSFALSAILVPVSNVSYGPGFGLKKPKEDIDVIEIYFNKMESIIHDLQVVDDRQIATPSQTILGDSRHMANYFKENSVSLMITSPPYPGDHEYTKHSKLELLFNDMAGDLNSFRLIKKRMLVSSTTNIYKENNAGTLVEHYESIQQITSEIQNRLDADHATSGYERLYTRLVWEYFGCMKQVLAECYITLKKGGKIALLVSDSHAFKMVHIQTAKILEEIGKEIGFINSKIVLWQLKPSTSHKYQLRENILILEK